jgi:threonyl-tRNA synthetase
MSEPHASVDPGHSQDARDELYKIRHSLAHVLAQAVLELRPGSTLGFGPPIKDGFYYDFILSSPITDEDLPELEKKMRYIIKLGQKFESEDLPRPEAMARLEQMGEPYKAEYAKELFDKHGIQNLTFYKSGPFVDMCEGPHVQNTRQIPLGGFKLRSVAGAYWRGDSKNVQMTRIYAWAFASKEELEAHVKAHKEALARDHKKLGRELEYFVIDDVVGKGLPLWLPNGTVIRDELEKLAKELEFKANYERVSTPSLCRADLFHQTGHLPYYQKHMYPLMELREEDKDGQQVVTETYALRPMNCPHHHRIFASKKRSYRDLPLRLAEYGNVYRFEDSGSLSGLLRVRGMTMNDAHIYCTAEQVKSEFLAVMEMHRRAYEILGLTDYYMRLSLWDPEDPKGKEKYVDDPAAWEASEQVVREAMIESGLPFTEAKGEAAFYGPKIDVQFRTVTGREETASTNQLDFAVPKRLGLTYVGPDGQEHHPYVIHRAPLGTHERFVAFLLERYAGAFPTWLAPVQVRVITVTDTFNEYAEKLTRDLRNLMIRVEFDPSNDTLSKKVRNASAEKIPNLVVIGEREVAENSVTLRRFGQTEQESMSTTEFRARLTRAIETRSLHPI